ncbi:MAG: response regulator [Porticoccaceae bacterium]|jgi:DNA-binding response OmpR family regulator|nr:response regulator [Porticoccaceae bacterium]MBT6800021.1 response regulator [Porticoccaceae bacterium]
MHILLVEDDTSLAAALCKALRQKNYAVNTVATGREALHVIRTEKPDMTILDLGLPDMDGIEVLKKARHSQPEIQILILTARSGTEEKITGLDSGADDYLAKPFEVDELLARLRVLERRLGSAKTSLVAVGDVVLDTTTNMVSMSGQNVELSRREYSLLRSLMENVGRVQTRSILENRLYGWGEEVSSNALEVHIHNLRKKLGSDFIKTVRGVGYRVNQR